MIVKKGGAKRWCDGPEANLGSATATKRDADPNLEVSLVSINDERGSPTSHKGGVSKVTSEGLSGEPEGRVTG